MFKSLHNILNYEPFKIKIEFPIKFELLPDGSTAKILEDCRIEIKQDKIITIPANFEIDFSNFPKIFWSFLPPWGRYSIPAVVHYYLYKTGEVSRKEADEIFAELLELGDIPQWKIKIMYWCLRIFGLSAWNKARHKTGKVKTILTFILLLAISCVFAIPDPGDIKFKDYYMGVKVVSAEQTSLIKELGYRVRYSDGDSSWVKAIEFNRMYMPLGKSCDDISAAHMDKIVEYFIRNLKVIETFDHTIYSIEMPGGRKQNFELGYDRETIKEEVRKWINFMIEWAITGIDHNNEFLPENLSESANYYLGAKIVQAKRSNNNNNVGYIIRYPEGDIGWIEEKDFKKIYTYLGDKKDIYRLCSREFISKFNIYKEKIDIKIALNFIREWGLFGIKEIKPYNANL